MEIVAIQNRITKLFKEHESCPSSTHLLAVIDNEILVIHDDRTLQAPNVIAKIDKEQYLHGLTVDEWKKFTRKIAKILNKEEPKPL